MLFIVIGVGLFFLDYKVKNHVEKKLELQKEKEACKGKIIIRKYHNYGAALNLLEKKQKILFFFNQCLLILLSVFYIKELFGKKNKEKSLAYTFLLAGGWNNFYDRWKRMYVVDYVSFKTKIKKLNDIVFNLSDFFIFIGSFILLLAEFKKDKSKKV